jgi:hypothetical protein
MRQAMGVVFAGMMGVTLFGLFLTPVFYVTVMKFGWRKSSGHKSNQKRSAPVESSQGAHRFGRCLSRRSDRALTVGDEYIAAAMVRDVGHGSLI